jgi:F0F1-type ATP synthase, subunit b
MMRRLLILTFLAVIALAVPLRAQAPANEVTHGSEKVAHELAHSDGAHGEGHKAPKTYFGIPGWILKLVNMLVFIGLLGYLLIGPIRTSFAARREQIRKQLKEAHARREKADRLAHDIEARLAQIEADVNAILERAKLEGEKQKQELLAAAEADAKKLLAAARAEVDARVKMARHELTALAADLATDRATALLRETMTETDRKRLFDESLGEIGGVTR